MTWIQDITEVLVAKARKKWGNQHRAHCLLCRRETESMLTLSPAMETAYLLCGECGIARAPLELVYK